MPSTAEIAKDLVALCREGKNMEAISKYYSKDIVSVESASGPNMPAEMKGLEAVEKKTEWWMDNHEVHGAEVDGPYIGENEFAARFIIDVTHKPTGQRMQMDEMGVYKVADGKIVWEKFFYNAGG